MEVSDLPDPERDVVALVREFVDEEVRPVARGLEHSGDYPERLIARMKQLGVFGLAVPDPYGEVHVSTPCFALVTEELARGWMSLAGAMGGHSVVCHLVASYGTDEQRERFLPRLATGELRATMALTEPGGGSDLQAMRTTARPVSGGYSITGSKTWITNARRAGLVALLCKTDPAARPPHTGMSILLVEKDRVPRDPPACQDSASGPTCRSSDTGGWKAASWSSTTRGCPPTRCSAARRARASRR